MNSQTAGPLDSRLNPFLICGVMLGLFMSGLDASIVNIMLPKLQSVFGVSISSVMLIATVYMSMMAAFQLFAGRCADIFNPLIVFTISLVVFCAGSLGCALSQTLYHILTARGIQGVGAAMLAASFGAIILIYVPREKTGGKPGRIIFTVNIFPVMTSVLEYTIRIGKSNLNPTL